MGEIKTLNMHFLHFHPIIHVKSECCQEDIELQQQISCTLRHSVESASDLIE